MGTKRLVIIDQSIRSPGGHWFEYSMRILEAARVRGLQTTLLAHRKFTGSVKNIRPTFSLNFWDNYRYYYDSERKWHAPPFMVKLYWRLDTLQLNLKRRLVYSRLGLAFARGRHHFVKQILFRAHLDEDSALVKSSRFALLVGRVQSVLLDYINRARGRRATRIGRRIVQVFIAVLTIPAVGLFSVIAFASRVRDPAKVFAREFQRYVGNEFSEDTIIFVPNATAAELEGLALLKQWGNSAAKAQWAFLFRLPVFSGHPDSFARQNESARSYRLQFARLKMRCPDLKVSFHTDTDELSAQYNFLGVYKFKTLPVPVDDLASAKEEPTAPKSLVVGYLGDARDEKGFQYLPEVVDSFCENELDVNVRFLFQANFNLPQGEPESRFARHVLQRYPSDLVELAYGPFDAEQYRALLRRMNVILIPYDSSRYAERSSGVLMEAISAGLPAVVPSCTWMARLAEPFRRKHLLSVLAGKYGALHRVGRLVSSYDKMNKRLLIDPQVNYVFVKLRYSRNFSSFVRIDLFLYDEFRFQHAQLLGSYRAIDGEILAAFAIPDGSRIMALGVNSAQETAIDEQPSEVEVDFYQAQEPLPLCAGIAIFDTPDQIAAETHEIVRFYAHHKRAAAVLKRELISHYDPGVLVSRLLGPELPAEEAPPAVFSEEQRFVA